MPPKRGRGAAAANAVRKRAATAAAAAAAATPQKEKMAVTVTHRWEDPLDVDEKGVHSKTVEAGGFEWRLWLMKWGYDATLWVECVSSRYPVWSVDAKVKIVLKDQGYGVDFVENMDHTFFMGNPKVQARDLDRYIQKNCGGDEPDIVKASVTITVKKRTGNPLRPKPEIDFYSLNEAKFDCELAVKKMKLYVNKQFLASHSDYFSDLFYGATADKDQKSFKVEKVEPEDLEKLVGFLYWIDLAEGKNTNMENAVNVDNWQTLAALAVQFKVQNLHNSVETYIMDTDELDKWNGAAKLREAEKYEMRVWKMMILSQLRTPAALKKTIKAEEYNDLSDELKEKLKEKLAYVKKHGYEKDSDDEEEEEEEETEEEGEGGEEEEEE